MKKLGLLFAFLFFGTEMAALANSQPRPRFKTKRAFAHTSESGQGRNSKARFRRENNIRPIIDLNPNSITKAKTIKAPKPYRYSKGNGFK